jgi:2-(1,2-epoxy-1,2-dihydrophenyl)acetyl-CoA isomerase
MASTVLLERDGPVAIVTLNRPDALNSFDDAMRRGLLAVLNEVGASASDRVVVLTGAGRCFSSGADLRVVDRLSAELVRRQLIEDYAPALVAISSMDKPVIAALNGPAVGIGLAFALSCDLLVIEETAYLQAPFGRLGLIPDGGLTWLLPRLVGYPRAYELAVEGEAVGAARCLELGLVNRIVPAGRALPAAVDWAHGLAARAPLALGAAKRAMRENLNRGYTEGLRLETEEQALVAGSEDCAEGVRAFLEKRAPIFRGR